MQDLSLTVVGVGFSMDGILAKKSYAFGVRTVKLYQYLSQTHREFVLSKQLLRSGTSIGANVAEANRAESKLDFIHKLAIAQKESFETEYWLRLLRDSDYLTAAQSESLLTECCELQKMLTASIKTAKRNIRT